MEIDEVLQDLALSDELFDDLNRDKNNCVNDECLVVQDCVINTSIYIIVNYVMETRKASLSDKLIFCSIVVYFCIWISKTVGVSCYH